jgi:hypothetical protein
LGVGGHKTQVSIKDQPSMRCIIFFCWGFPSWNPGASVYWDSWCLYYSACQD